MIIITKQPTSQPIHGGLVPAACHAAPRLQSYDHVNVNGAPALLTAPLDPVNNLSYAAHGMTYYKPNTSAMVDARWYFNASYNITVAEVGGALLDMSTFGINFFADLKLNHACSLVWPCTSSLGVLLNNLCSRS
jgi:hypothetical protein